MQQQPPVFELPRTDPPRRSNRTLWIVLACVLIPCCGGGLVLGYFAWRGIKEVLPFMGCMEGLHSISSALDSYAREHQGKLPKADRWQEEIKPYFTSRMSNAPFKELKGFSADGVWGCADSDGRILTGFAFNKELAGREASKIEKPLENPVVFEVPNSGLNLSDVYRLRPFEASPRVMGQKRGWLELSITGETHALKEYDGKPVRVRVNARGGGADIFDDDDPGVPVQGPSTLEESSRKPPAASKAAEPNK